MAATKIRFMNLRRAGNNCRGDGQLAPARSAVLRRHALRPRPYRDHFIPHKMEVNQLGLFRRVEVSGYGVPRPVFQLLPSGGGRGDGIADGASRITALRPILNPEKDFLERHCNPG